MTVISARFRLSPKEKKHVLAIEFLVETAPVDSYFIWRLLPSSRDRGGVKPLQSPFELTECSNWRTVLWDGERK